MLVEHDTGNPIFAISLDQAHTQRGNLVELPWGATVLSPREKAEPNGKGGIVVSVFITKPCMPSMSAIFPSQHQPACKISHIQNRSIRMVCHTTPPPITKKKGKRGGFENIS